MTASAAVFIASPVSRRRRRQLAAQASKLSPSPTLPHLSVPTDLFLPYEPMESGWSSSRRKPLLLRIRTELGMSTSGRNRESAAALGPVGASIWFLQVTVRETTI